MIKFNTRLLTSLKKLSCKKLKKKANQRFYFRAVIIVLNT